ncbi:hypothetical protein TNCV_1414861 [Trichonephila clavipes]|nr:hypothetical protein TNCV_1414861 [Trichonephila clavipes]
MLPGSSTSLTALFHGCGSHLKLLECKVDGTGEVVLEVRRLQKTDISSYQQKGTGAPQLSSTVLPVCNGVVSITIGLNRTGHAYYSQMSRFSLSSDCRHQLIWREWYCLSSRKYPEKGPISDMQYHGVGRHHDQWPHAPTCGCEWDYDGPTIH